MTLPLLVVILFLAASLVWVGANLPHLIGFTATVLDWCQSILALCLSYTSVIKAALIWAGTLTIALGFVYGATMALWRFLKGRRAIKKFPVLYNKAKGTGTGVRLIKDDELNAAFTYGLIRPRIYVSTGLLNKLSRDELRAVLLHEIHHKKNRDPLRFFLLSFLEDAFFYLPIGGYIKRRLQHIKERAADDAVIDRTKDPLGLAGALLKVAGHNGSERDIMVLQPASIKGFGFIEARIRRLVGEEERILPPALRTVVSSALVAAFMLISISLPVFASTFDPGSCDMKHCSVHVEKMGANCKSHCELKH